MPTPSSHGEPALATPASSAAPARGGDQPEEDRADRAVDGQRGAAGVVSLSVNRAVLDGGERAEEHGGEQAGGDQPDADLAALRVQKPRRLGATASVVHGHRWTSRSPALRHAGLQAARRGRRAAGRSPSPAPGAAMKMTISAWSTVTSSSEMPENDCIRLPPACSAPNSSAASSDAPRLDPAEQRDQEAVEADRCRPPAAVRASARCRAPCIAPPSPASAPATTMTSDVRRARR